MRNPQTFMLVAFGVVLFMGAMAVLVSSLRRRRMVALQAHAGDAAAVSRLENEGGHHEPGGHTP